MFKYGANAKYQGYKKVFLGCGRTVQGEYFVEKTPKMKFQNLIKTLFYKV